jgi:cation/acetate symporter
LVLLVLALYARAGAVAQRRPVSDFYVAGRLVPAPFNGVAIAIGLVPVLAFAGFAGALSQGWDGASLLAIGAGAGLAAIAFLIAPYLRKFGGFTLPDFLGERFNMPGIRPLAALAVILCTLPGLALIVLGLSTLATRIFAIDLLTGAALAAAMLLSCSFAAGMRSASLTQIVQYAVALAASLTAVALLLWQYGTLAPVLDAGRLEAAFATLKLESFVAEDGLNRFAMLFCVAAGIAALPHLLARALITPSIDGARTSFLWALPFTAVLCLVGAPYLTLFEQAPGATADVPALLAFGFTALGAIAALLALGSGLLLAAGNALSFDLYYKGVQSTASTERHIFVARAAILAVALLAAWAALGAPEAVLTMTAASFSLAASAFLPALILGIWWKRARAEGALAGMLAGLAVCLYYILAPRYFPFAFYETSSFLSGATSDETARYYALRQSYDLAGDTTRDAALAAWEEAARAVANWGGVKKDFAGLFAVPVGFLVTIGVSLFTPAPAREVQSFVEELRKPQAA